MKLMWVRRSNWAFAARITDGGRCPTVWTPIPPPRSTYTFPSASRTRGPSAHVTSIGRPIRTPFEMNFVLRAAAALEFGPGGTATIFGPRVRGVDGRFVMESCFAGGRSNGSAQDTEPRGYRLSIRPGPR